jgi:hypothetical protein
MISIDGLTTRQILLLDIMWAMDTMDQIRGWQRFLSDRDKADSEILLNLVAICQVDELTESSDFFPEAWDLLDVIMNKPKEK